MIFANWLI